MKKLLYGLPLLLVGCQAFKDVGGVIEDVIVTPPGYLIDALKVVLNFLQGVLGAAVSALLHGLLPL